jgi:nucleotide-binding universal stress UspA family protein
VLGAGSAHPLKIGAGVAIRSILLHLDATPASIGRLTFAHALADRSDARITALFGVRPRASRAAFAYSAGAALRAADEERVPHEFERAHLRELLAERAPECAWCEVAGDSLRHAFIAEAVYADLLVIGPPSRIDEEGTAPTGFVDAVILESGTPAIVVPHPHRQETVGERVVVAWNGSVAAARALRAALPLLRGASTVHVATWGAQPQFAPFSRLDVRAWLRRHDIDAELHAADSVAHVANDLAALASDVRADLIVMGCYGHSRIREQVFGGVTRALLNHLPTPILMTH